MDAKSAAFAVVLWSFASTARAADPDPAALAYQRALDLYAAGDVAGALASMRDSLQLSGRPELLYNIARLESESGDCAASLADYRRYLESVPHGQYRSEAERASAELAGSCPADSAPQPELLAIVTAPASTAVAPASTVDSAGGAESTLVSTSGTRSPKLGAHREGAVSSPAAGDTRRWIGWSAIAAGGLAGLGALYFTVAAVDARSRFRSSLEREVAGGARADFGLQDEQHRDQRWAQVLAVTGGALVGGGVLVLALGGRTPASARVTAGVWLTPDRISAQLASRF